MTIQLERWNRLFKQQEKIYHQWAKKTGLADAQFWVLYGLCETEEPLCQNTFCEHWCYSKQTVSTAVSGLEKAGLIQLVYQPGSRKKKDILLTEKGEAFCDQNIRSLQTAEEKVLNMLSEEKQQAFFQSFEDLLQTLEREVL